MRLADLYGLTFHDAAYLELAQRLRLPLATLDGDSAKRLDAQPALRCCHRDDRGKDRQT